MDGNTEDQATKAVYYFILDSDISFTKIKKELLSKHSVEGLTSEDFPVWWRETCKNKKSQCQQVFTVSDYVLTELTEGATN